MSKKIFINAGHGGNDSGAVKYVVEKNVNLIEAKACRDYLIARGVEAYMSQADLNDESQSSTDVLNEIKKFNPDFAIDIHNNAGGGKGFEIYCGISGLGTELAKNIEAEVKAIGQNSRGVKTKKNSNGKDYYYFIRQTSCPAVICEGAFVDNKSDVEMIDTEAKCVKFGEAYAKGILKTLGIEDTVIDNKNENSSTTTNKTTETESYLVKVTANVLNIRQNAGTNYKKVGCIKDKGTYTIVAEADGQGATKWGKLKSGKGWISLDYVIRV